MKKLIKPAITGPGSVWPKRFVLLLLLATVFLPSLHLQGQSYSCGKRTKTLTNAPLNWVVSPVLGTKDSWIISFSGEPSLDSIHKVRVDLALGQALKSGFGMTLTPGNHSFNLDSKASWSTGLAGSNQDTLVIEGLRPTCEGRGGAGNLFTLTLSKTGVNHNQKLSTKIGGIVIADVAIGVRLFSFPDKVSPNPVQTHLNLPKLECEGGKVSVFKSNGQLLHQQPMISGQMSRLYLTSLPPGIYLIRLEAPCYIPQFYRIVKD